MDDMARSTQAGGPSAGGPEHRPDSSRSSGTRGQGRRVALSIILATLAVLAVALVMFRDAIIEQWYLRRLERGDESERRAAARFLGSFSRGETTAQARRVLLARLRHLGALKSAMTESDDACLEGDLPTLFALVEDDLVEDCRRAGAGEGSCDWSDGLVETSRLLADGDGHRSYAASHFGEIRLPILRAAWGTILLDRDEATSEVTASLRATLETEDGKSLLRQLYGPEWPKFFAAILRRTEETAPR